MNHDLTIDSSCLINFITNFRHIKITMFAFGKSILLPILFPSSEFVQHLLNRSSSSSSSSLPSSSASHRALMTKIDGLLISSFVFASSHFVRLTVYFWLRFSFSFGLLFLLHVPETENYPITIKICWWLLNVIRVSFSCTISNLQHIIIVLAVKTATFRFKFTS